tara:strand:+ start:41 stop:406 length:366 start_codon:yes stop_codon:yes gene_type:complete
MRRKIEYTVKVFENGTKHRFLNGKLHREDGPAIESADGTKHWYLDGKKHREDGPAAEYADGTKHWYLNNNLHREDGPAVELADGDKHWFLNGKEVTEQEVMKSSGKIVEIDGKKYKLEEVP